MSFELGVKFKQNLTSMIKGYDCVSQTVKVIKVNKRRA